MCRVNKFSSNKTRITRFICLQSILSDWMVCDMERIPIWNKASEWNTSDARIIQVYLKIVCWNFVCLFFIVAVVTVVDIVVGNASLSLTLAVRLHCSWLWCTPNSKQVFATIIGDFAWIRQASINPFLHLIAHRYAKKPSTHHWIFVGEKIKDNCTIFRNKNKWNPYSR